MELGPRQTLRKAGFFHFGSRGNNADPIRVLKACLVAASESHDLSECLIVLPEAFNVLGEYWDRASRRLDTRIAAHLHEISVNFEVALVAGLIEGGSSLGHGYNSAYLIDQDVYRLISRKTRPDGSDLYLSCTHKCSAVVHHRGITIAALICVDGLEFNRNSPNQSQSTILAEMRTNGMTPSIVCIPSHSGEYGTKEVAFAWPPDVNLIVANSCRRRSSVNRPAGATDADLFSGDGDAVCIALLA